MGKSKKIEPGIVQETPISEKRVRVAKKLLKLLGYLITSGILASFFLVVLQYVELLEISPASQVLATGLVNTILYSIEVIKKDFYNAS